MSDKPRWLSKEHTAALAPFAAILCGAYAMLGELPDDDLLELRAACENVSQINCWCMTYDAARVFRSEIDRHILQRGLDAPTDADALAQEGTSNG